MKPGRNDLLPMFLALFLLVGQAVCRAETLPPQAAVVAEETPGHVPDTENDPDLYLQLIGRMQGKSLYFASLAHLDAFDQRWPGNTRAALLRGDALRETEYFERAKTIYRSLLKGEQSAAAYHGLGIIAGRQGEWPAALDSLEKANQLAPTNVSILNDLGYLQLLGGHLEDARLSLHKAAELDQRNTRVGSNLALLYLLEKKTERAQGIMKWYQLPENKRQEIVQKSRELMMGEPRVTQESAEFDANGQKIDKVESVSRRAQEQ